MIFSLSFQFGCCSDQRVKNKQYTQKHTHHQTPFATPIKDNRVKQKQQKKWRKALPLEV